MDSCDSTGRSRICGGRQKMILAQLAMDFRSESIQDNCSFYAGNAICVSYNCAGIIGTAAAGK